VNFTARSPVVLVDMDTWLARIPVDGGFVELPTGPPPLTQHPATPPPGRSHPSGLPSPATVARVPGHATAAGWSFLDGPSAMSGPAVAFVVEVIVRNGGFEVTGRPSRSADLAAHLRAVCPPGPPVLLVPSGTATSALALTLLVESLVDAFGRPIVAGDAATRFTPAGIALGEFRRFHPRTGRSKRRVDEVGAALPAPPAGLAAPPPLDTPSPPARRDEPAVAPPARPEDPAVPSLARRDEPAVAPPARPEDPAVPGLARRDEPAVPSLTRRDEPALAPPAEPALTGPIPVEVAVAELCVPGRPIRQFRALAGPATSIDPDVGTIPPPPSPVATPPVVPDPGGEAGTATPARWLTGTTADRAAVRQALNGRYDAHARIVARRLSEDPGLRSVAGSAADITAGLVAVRAYLLEERETMNRVLRGQGADGEHARAEVLAGTAVYGLHRLPPVFGPVFHSAAATGRAAAAYRPGEELIEPAFLDVGLAPAAPDEETTLEIAIWSVSARRVGGLEAGQAAALFPPGSRFTVLAVDSGEGAPRVLLRDLSVRRGGREDPDRILSRLREARPAGRAPGPGQRSRIAPGLDDQGLRFRRPAQQRPRQEDGAS
jgi:hypothetical protein